MKLSYIGGIPLKFKSVRRYKKFVKGAHYSFGYRGTNYSMGILTSTYLVNIVVRIDDIVLGHTYLKEKIKHNCGHIQFTILMVSSPQENNHPFKAGKTLRWGFSAPLTKGFKKL